MVSSPGSKSPNQKAPDLRSQAVANYTIIKGGTAGGIRTHSVSYVADFESAASRQFRHCGIKWSIRWDSNPQPLPWQGSSLAIEILTHCKTRLIHKSRIFVADRVFKLEHQIGAAPT